VIPIWWIDEKTGRCACGQETCRENRSDGKHPLIKMGKGMRGATNDLNVVSSWWDTWPNANIAVACGQESGIFVVDCDVSPEHDGELEFRQWCGERGLDVPDTLMQRTGSGRVHFFFKFPEDGAPLKNCNSWLEDVDVKSDGGYVLVAPSRNMSGPYEWLQLLPVASAPGSVVSSIRLSKSGSGGRTGRRSGGGSGDGGGGEDDGAGRYAYREACRNGPRLGHRDDFFNARSFELRMAGIEKDVAVAELRYAWERMENPVNDYFTWEAALAKLERVWEECSPEQVPDWKPVWGVKPAGLEVGKVELVTEEAPHNRASDLGNGHLFATTYRDVVRWTAASGWLLWDGERWKVDSRQEILEYARRVVTKIFEQAVGLSDDDRDAMLSWAKKSSQMPRVEAMVKAALTYGMVKADINEFDSNGMLLSCPNGTIDLTTGELREHRREDFITQRTEVEYHPDAYDESWVRYLEVSTAGDQDLIAYLRRAAGYTLTGSTQEESFFLLYGPPASGKTTWITMLESLLGAYAINTQPENLMQRKGMQATPANELARMRGKRLVTSVEPQDGDRFAESLIKQMTGGDTMTARFLYQNAFEFKPVFKLWLATNHKPRSSDEGLFRRLKLVPFPVSLPYEQRDPAIKEGLKVPWSSISQAALAWAVRGCLEWQKTGLGSCAAVERDTSEYKQQEDLVGQFLAQCVILEETAVSWIEARDLYEVWKYWCQTQGEYVKTMRSFVKELEAKGVKTDRKGRHLKVGGVQIVEGLPWRP